MTYLHRMVVATMAILLPAGALAGTPAAVPAGAPAQANPALPSAGLGGPGGGPNGPRVIALLPLNSGAAVDKTPQSKALSNELEVAIANLALGTPVPASTVEATLKQQKKAVYLVCEGEPACYVEAGKAVGANVVIAGEVGGLADARVVYLVAIDVATGKQLAGTTVKLGSAEQGGGRGAVVRLLAPDQFVGKLTINVDAAGATAYIDGTRVGISPMPPITVSVGTHALRVTHPEYRDFVRFVDVEFGDGTNGGSDASPSAPAGNRNTIVANMTQFPIVQNALIEGPKAQARRVITMPTPWYRKWYTVAGGAAALMLAGGIVGYAVWSPAHDEKRTLP